jgi:hypothetical protein
MSADPYAAALDALYRSDHGLTPHTGGGPLIADLDTAVTDAHNIAEAAAHDDWERLHGHPFTEEDR